MERLTYNEVLAKQYYPNENIDNEEIFNKLGKLEDIEQELGIPLEVLFKALKDGIWYRNDYYNPSQIDFNFNFKHLIVKYWFKGWEDSDCLEIKDYGKTWWLEEPKEKASD